VLACVLGHDGRLAGGTPSYAFPEQAVQALARIVDFVRRRDRPAVAAEAQPWCRDRAAAALVRRELAAHPGGRWLDQPTAARLLACYGVHVAESISVDGPESAAEAAAFTGLPAALKATGPGLIHKSDVGGVALGLATPADVARAYREMSARLGPAMTGALVQPMAADGVEIIIGGVEHPAFGPLIMVGMGGPTAELLTDRAFRVPPVTRHDAAEMLRELRSYPLLTGYRGRPKANIAALEEQIVRVARFLGDVPEAAELDLNPVLVTPRGAVAVDVRLRLAPLPPPPSPYRRRLR